MPRSARAYVRESMQHFYEWVIGESGHKLPEVPPNWICANVTPETLALLPMQTEKLTSRFAIWIKASSEIPRMI
jgi:hypothetical protein